MLAAPLLAALAPFALAVSLASAAPQRQASAVLAKTTHCANGQVGIKSKKGIRCYSFGGTLPAPIQADQRKLEANFALGAAVAHARDIRGRRPVTLSKLFHRVRPNALHTAEAAIALGLTKVDQIAARSASRARAAPAGVAATAGCSGASGAPSGSEGYKGSGFDAKVDLAKGEAQLGVDLKGNGTRIEIDLGLCDEKDSFKIPECPTAEGVLEASDQSRFFASIRAFEKGTLTFSQHVSFEGQTTMRAQVADDAKLDYLDIKRVYRTSIQMGGSRQAYGPLSLQLAFTGSTRVDMRTGAYDAANTNVEASFQSSGIDQHERRAAELDQAKKAQKQADEDFATEIKKAIDKFREKETGWNKPNTCASVSFEPASETLTLRKGEGGTVSPKIQSKQGGSPPTAMWNLSDPENASFNPSAGNGNPFKVSYTVTNAGLGVHVKGTFKALSRAGVAEDTWTQNTKVDPPPPPAFNGPISGSANYDESEMGAGNHIEAEWSGSVELREVPPLLPPGEPGAPAASYEITSGSIIYTYRGRVDECDLAASEAIDLGAQPDLTGTPVLELFNGEPRTYQFVITMPLLIQVHSTTSNCAESERDGQDFGWPPATSLPAMVNAPLPGGPLAKDWSFSGSGSGNTGEGTPAQTWQWSMTPAS